MQPDMSQLLAAITGQAAAGHACQVCGADGGKTSLIDAQASQAAASLQLLTAQHNAAEVARHAWSAAAADRDRLRGELARAAADRDAAQQECKRLGAQLGAATGVDARGLVRQLAETEHRLQLCRRALAAAGVPEPS